MSIDIEALAREIAARIAPDALLTYADASALLAVSESYFRDHYAPAPGFPKPLRLVGVTGKPGHPRYLRADLIAWINAQRPGAKGGRPRKA